MVAAGEEIPRKGGPGELQSQTILNHHKTDLAPHVGASLEVMDRDGKTDARDPALYSFAK